jgi:hypothetical protein
VKSVAALSLVWVLLAACGSDRLEEIEAETKKLQSERVEASAVTAAQAEADAAEQRLATTKKELDLLHAETQRLTDQKQKLEAAITKEGELTAQAVSQTAQLAQQTAAELAEVDNKDKEIETRRARALLIRKEAAALAREMRPGDPPWATARRVKSVDEFLARVATAYPDDPVVAELVAQGDQSAGDPVQAAALAAEKAARLRDRFTRVYELDTPDVAAGAKEATTN